MVVLGHFGSGHLPHNGSYPINDVSAKGRHRWKWGLSLGQSERQYCASLANFPEQLKRALLVDSGSSWTRPQGRIALHSFRLPVDGILRGFADVQQIRNADTARANSWPINPQL
jgi:hypothetical protein